MAEGGKYCGDPPHDREFLRLRHLTRHTGGGRKEEVEEERCRGGLRHLTRHTCGGRKEEKEEEEEKERCRGGLRHLTRRTQPTKTKSGLAYRVESKVY